MYSLARMAERQMTIQFSEQELAEIKNYLNNIEAGETQTHLYGLNQAFPEWNTVFLLLRKLLAYGVHYTVQTDPEISYEDLQKESQKPADMLLSVHAYLGKYKELLAAYIVYP